MKLSITQWTSAFLITILLLGVINISIFLYSRAEAEKNEQWVIHTHNVIQASTELLSYLKDTETGQRGYLLTLNPSYLEPFNSGKVNARSTYNKIKVLTSNNASQLNNLIKIESLIDQKIAELQQTVDLARAGDIAQALDIVKTDLGKSLMDDIRSSVKAFIAEEKRLLEVRSARHQSYKNNSQDIIFTIITLLTVLLLLSAYLLQRKIIKPIVNLTDRAEKFSQNYAVLENRESAVAEIGLLAQAFQKMSKDVVASMGTLSSEKAQSEQDAEAKGKFLANMSHEIRTPINGIFGSLQLLERRGFSKDKEYQELLSQSLFSCQSLLTIINDILDFSKIEAGKLTIEKSAFNFEEILQQVSFTLNPEARRKGVVLEMSAAEGFVDGWLGDPVRVQQICLNLLSNSVKFTERGKITLKYDVRQHKGNDSLFIELSDTGIGMTEQALAKLFDRFEQADTSTTRKYGGTGLGVAITRQLVELMNGSIDVTSEVNKGTTFTIHLPLEQVQIDKLSNKEISEYCAPDLSGVTILLAEDNKVNQTIIKAMFKETHADLVIANNGAEAVDMVEQNQPTIVFMDIQMPVMSGIEAFRIIRQKHPALPVIALTANVMDSDILKYESEGFDSYLGKPIDLLKLYRFLAQYSLKKSAVT